jgi:hypothetical protein
MREARTLSLDEKLTISNKAIALWEAGDIEGYRKLMKKLHSRPYLEKVHCNKGDKARRTPGEM